MKTRILKMMMDEGVGSNPCCVECRGKETPLSNALSPWIVCDGNISNNNILFVGKIARGDDLGEEIATSLEDVVPFGTDFVKECPWAYWAYTRAIVEAVYKDLESGLKHVSFTNMIKCNNESTPDTSSYDAKVCCIRKNRFIWKEIEILKPRVAVFIPTRITMGLLRNSDRVILFDLKTEQIEMNGDLWERRPCHGGIAPFTIPRTTRCFGFCVLAILKEKTKRRMSNKCQNGY